MGSNTTLKGKGEGFSAWYDHIYVDRNATKEATGKGNALDFMKDLGYTKTQQAKKEISDHVPVWAEFRVDGQDDD